VDATGNLDGAGWNVLACNQLAMPTTNGNTSMFIPNDPFDYNAYTAMCQTTYGLTPRYNWVWEYFGGQDIQKDFAGHSNIIFTNGELDPWRAGGVNANITASSSIQVLYLKNAAHHLELRTSNPADPPDIVAVRATILATLQSWIKEYNSAGPTFFDQ